MSHRSWLWKKKSSEKVISAASSLYASLPNSVGNKVDEDDSKKVKYVQIAEESYAHLSELEDQVKLLNEKLSAALSEITTKDNLVKQHTKVAEEAVSGWEKAEAEAIALKSQLESVMLLKLTAEDKASHLDGALKECMRQIRNVREESEQKLHDVVFAKTKQWEKAKEEFEAKIVNLNQELLRASAENDALSRSLHEHSTMLMKMSDEKSQADAYIEVLKSNMQSCEKEISSLKYELHISSKELEIRNEEKNMSLRSAEVANKQHLEGVKKIAKLEAECQRLRGLVRKKLPGPAALAQMKLEVENLGRDYGEPRVRRSPVKNSSQHLVSPTDFSLESVQNKENEFLTARLMTMEEETKLLKEALSKRNSELQASRNMCAKTASKLRSLEAQLQTVCQRQNPPGKLNLMIPLDASLSQNTSNPPSLSSMSEDGIDEEASVADSSVSSPFPELSQFKKNKNQYKSSKKGSSNDLELMQDFLEMEKLAFLSMESNGVASATENGSIQITGIGDSSLVVDGALAGMTNGEAPNLSSNEKDSAGQPVRTQSILEKLQSRISLTFENLAKDTDCSVVFDEIRRAVQDIQEDLPQNSVNCVFEKPMDNGSSLPCYTKPCIESKQPCNKKMEKALSDIREFVGLLRKEAILVEGWEDADSGLSQKIDMLFISIDKVLSSQMNLTDFIIELSCILGGAREFGNTIGTKGTEREVNNYDCVDKVTLLENVVQPDHSKERISSEHTLVSHSTLDSDIHQEGSLNPGVEVNAGTFRYNMEEFEQMKQQRDSMLIDLARCNESLEQKRLQIEEKEKLLVELRSQLTTSQKSNSLSETQLKCMVESYRLLEARAEDLEAEINLLRVRAENLETELHEERRSRDDVSAKCKDIELKCKDLEIKCKDLEASCKDYETRCKELDEQIQRTEKGSMCSSSAPDPDRIKQDRDIAAAAEKLAECQETIFLLSKQLNTLRAPNDPVGPSYNERRQLSIDFQENEPSPSQVKPRNARSQDFDRTGLESIASIVQRTGSESPLNLYSAPMSPDTEASAIQESPRNLKHPTQRSTRSSSSSSSMIMTPEKHGRGFSRFFSIGKGAAK